MIRRLLPVIASVAALLAIGTGTAHATETVVPMKPEPVLVLKGYKTDPATLIVGNKFKLDVTLDNVVNADADNVVVTVGLASGSATSTLGGTAGVSAPDVVVLGSNTRFLGTVDGRATNVNVPFELMSHSGGAAGPFTLPVTIQFDNPNGGRITSQQTVGLMFTRTLVFDVGSLTYPRSAVVGKPFSVSLGVKNTNEFTINGVSLAFEGAGADWVSREATIGVLESGKEAKLVGTGIPREPGPLMVAMSITYKDDYNQPKQIRREFSIAVKPKPAEPAEKPRPTTGQIVALFLKALVGLGG